MNDWYITYIFDRDWMFTKETLGILKYYYPNTHYTAILTALYYADIKAFVSYGATITCSDSLVIEDDLEEDEYLKIMFYLKNKIPIPIDILETINYDEIEPVSEDDQWNTCDSDRSTLIEIMDDLPDITIIKHKKKIL